MSNELPFAVIRRLLNEGKVVPFLGAGASVGFRLNRERTWPDDEKRLLPFAGELAAEIVRWLELQPDAPPDLPAAAHHYASAVGRVDLNEQLHRIFASEKPRLRRIHKLLATVDNLPLIVTTNYDRLIETALDAAGKEFDVVVQTVAKKGPKLLFEPYRGDPEPIGKTALNARLAESKRTIVYKLHGSVMPSKPEQDAFVITDGDYLDFLLGMPRTNAFPARIGDLLVNSSLLFIGYGLRDWNVRMLLARVRQVHERSLEDRKWWAIDERPSEYETAFWDAQGLKVARMPLDYFAKRLAGKNERA